MDLFFYGTLRYAPLLRVVLGASYEKIAPVPAVLQGHQPRAILGENFPMIVPMEGQTNGMLCRGLSPEDVARVNFYEGGYNYELREVTVETDDGPTQTLAYFAMDANWRDNGLWKLAEWEPAHGELVACAAEEVMSYFGIISAAQLEFMFPMIRARASAKLTAAKEKRVLGPSGYSRADTQTLNIETNHKGFFILNTAEVSYRQYDGTMSPAVNREVFVGTEASIVLPYDPVRDRVLLVEQFRAGPFVRGDKAPWMLEPIAGRVNPGETPEEAAHREGFEETNLTFSDLHTVAKVYASPGCNTEYFNIFLGITDLPDDIVGVSGLESEAEDIRSYLYSFDELMEMTDSYQAANAPLVLAALWLSRHRKRLHHEFEGGLSSQ